MGSLCTIFFTFSVSLTLVGNKFRKEGSLIRSFTDCFFSISHWPLSFSTSFCGPFLLSPCLSLEKAMAPHSSTLAWKIPWTEEPGRLQSIGSQSRTRLSDFTSQWLRLHPPNAGDLDEGTRSHMPELKEFKCCN